MRCQDCGDYAQLFRSVARSRAWVEACLSLLEIEYKRQGWRMGQKTDYLEQVFADYFLQLFTSDEPVPAVQKRLWKELARTAGLDYELVKDIALLQAQRRISSILYTPPSKESAVQQGAFLQVGTLNLYCPQPEVSVETLLRYELLRRSWRLDWSLCPGTVVGGVVTQLGAGNYFSLFNEDTETKGPLQEGALVPGQLVSSILSHNSVYNERLLAQLATHDTVLLLSDADTAPQGYWRQAVLYKPNSYIYLFGKGDKAALIEAFKAQIPPLPKEDLDFEAMFARLQDLAQEPPVDWARNYRNYDPKQLVTPNLELGLVRRNFPGDYYAADAISDVFSHRVRMECHTTNRKTGRENQSPFNYWTEHRFFTHLLREKNKLANKQALIDFLYDQTPSCSLFNAGLATYIYTRFGGPGSRVLDGFAGWGDRLIAAAAAGCSEYHGFDTNTKIPYPEMVARLGLLPTKYRVEILPFEQAQLKDDYYDVALLSPPFFQYEIYLGSETSTTLYKNLNDWLESFWRVSLEITLQALRPGGWLVLYLPAGKDETARGMLRVMYAVLENQTLKHGVLGYAYVTNENAPKIRQSFVFRKL